MTSERQLAHDRKWRAANRDKARLAVRRYFIDIEIFERDGWIRQLCNQPIDPELQWPHPHSRSLDHVVALINGGSHSRVNTQASHLVCNQRKGDRAVTLVSIAD
jgi:hypothetical protein